MMEAVATGKWERLAQRIVTRRVELDMPTTKTFADATGLSTRVLGEIENARRTSYRKSTIMRIEQALKWKQGSIQAVLDGNEPQPLIPIRFDDPHEQSIWELTNISEAERLALINFLRNARNLQQMRDEQSG